MNVPARLPSATSAPPHAAAAPCADRSGPRRYEERHRGGAGNGYVAVLLLWVALVVPAGGCASSKYLAKRPMRENALAGTLKLVSSKGPQVRNRTAHLLRRYGLSDQYEQDPVEALEVLRVMPDEVADIERQFAVAELAYIQGKRAEKEGQVGPALDFYTLALISSYKYLFANDYDALRNPYDPQFRGACDLYNEALEDMLRLLCGEHRVRPGQNFTVQTSRRQFTIETVMPDSWAADEFDHFEFVSDFEIQTLNNRHTSYGLGVPLIAVRKPPRLPSPAEAYLPEGVSFPVTALLRPVRDRHASRREKTSSEPGEATSAESPQAPRCVLEFFDPLESNQIRLADHWVPLQTDLTTPLAYFLDTPKFRKRNMPTAGLLDPNQQQNAKGLFMLEPYDPERIPVVMVHGLWSSPLTWMDMFNDLRSFPEIRQRYQFWFYLYPTGQPFWISATQMRGDLVRARQTLNPRNEHPTMDQMVLVGHSMGGLVSRMQTINSGDDFWHIVTDQPVEELRGEPDDVQKLVSTLKFRPSDSVARVVTIATPHRGSEFANQYTQWLGRTFIKLPKFAISVGNRLTKENPGFFKDSDLLTMTTSIDSLSPSSPIFPVMLRAKRSPRVAYHNIVGVIESRSLLGSVTRESDGVVAYSSASMKDVESEVVVDADHTTIHTRPETILEVRRILLEHAATIDRAGKVAERMEPAVPGRDNAVQPAARFEYPEALGDLMPVTQ